MNESTDPVSSALGTLITAAKGDDALERKLRMATTAGAIADAAAAAGLKLDPAAVVKHYARQLLEADDATTVHNFDLCSWDAGELLWAMKNWKASADA
jgi:hypothetical protein